LILIPENSGGVNGGFLNSTPYSWMGVGLTEKLIHIISNPWEIILKLCSNTTLLLTLAVVYASFPIRARFLFLTLPVIPMVVIYGLASIDNYSKLTGHYAVIYLVPAVIAMWFNVEDASKIYKRLIICSAVLTAFLVSPMLISYNFILGPYQQYRYNSYSILQFDADKICNNLNQNDIVISENNINYSCIFNRKYYTTFPERPNLDVNSTGRIIYILRNKAPFFLLDKSCNYKGSKCHDTQLVRERLSIVDNIVAASDILFQNSRFTVYSYKTAANEK
jgi:hypothetical protein